MYRYPSTCTLTLYPEELAHIILDLYAMQRAVVAAIMWGRGAAEGNDVTHARLAEPVAAALGARVEVAVGTDLNLVHLQQTHSTLPVQSPRYDSQCTSTCTCNRKCTRTCTSMCMFMYANYA